MDLYARIGRNTDVPENEQACWPWLRQRDRWGYGRMNLYVPGLGRAVKVQAHVLLWVCVYAQVATPNEAYLAYLELVTSGLEIDHLCVEAACCNPDHLEVVTASENCRRREARKFRDWGPVPESPSVSVGF